MTKADLLLTLNTVQATTYTTDAFNPKSTSAMAKSMNAHLQTLYDQIGRTAFFMMGAKHITFDNATNELRWRIANSTIRSIGIRYHVAEDLYELSFLTESKTTISEIVIEQVEAGDLHATIERMTGLRLSLTRIYAG